MPAPSLHHVSLRREIPISLRDEAERKSFPSISFHARSCFWAIRHSGRRGDGVIAIWLVKWAGTDGCWRAWWFASWIGLDLISLWLGILMRSRVQVGLILACSVWKVEFWFSSMVSNTSDSMFHLWTPHSSSFISLNLSPHYRVSAHLHHFSFISGQRRHCRRYRRHPNPTSAWLSVSIDGREEEKKSLEWNETETIDWRIFCRKFSFNEFFSSSRRWDNEKLPIQKKISLEKNLWESKIKTPKRPESRGERRRQRRFSWPEKNGRDERKEVIKCLINKHRSCPIHWLTRFCESPAREFPGDNTRDFLLCRRISAGLANKWRWSRMTLVWVRVSVCEGSENEDKYPRLIETIL